MMLKNVFFYLLLFTSIINSQDFTGIRIYINPGHGGHDSNDRYIAATGFWESDGNLGKGLHLKSILDSFNATTKISRTTNNSSDDLGLSVISADANNFDADYFHSIHSNGWQGDRNYTLILFQGFDNNPTYDGAKEMGGYLATEIKTAHRTSAQYNRGDADFYGTGAPYLGVFKGLAMPGTLSEGSFHDYIPESWRLRNNAYLKHEAWAITKAFIQYFELTTLPYGEIAGILRDPFDIVDYYYLNSNDAKVPLNFVQATLLPDNKLHLGDALNNGFYMFDMVPAGTYDLILVAENYEVDTVYNVTVIPNKTTFVDRNLTPKPNYSAPVVNSFFPSDVENVRLDSDIILEFNVKMDQVAVEQAFSISPNVVGTFSWESNDRIMIFSPNEYLQGGTDYQVGLNIFAKSAYNIFIEQPFSRFFTTRSALSIIDAYPDQASNNISTTVKIILSFDAPIDVSTLGGNISFQDMNGNNISPILDEGGFAQGKIIFEPMESLDYNTSYQIKLSTGLKDTEGSNLTSDTTIVFTTESKIVDEGSLLFSFEDIGNWEQPSQSGSVNIDVEKTKLSISSKKNVDGEFSGKLNYVFSQDSMGMCRIYNKEEPNIFTESNVDFGIWIYGDLSYNNLQIWFQNVDSSMIQVNMEYLDWTGWKFLELNLNSLSNLKFNSIVIVQNKLGESSGLLYFDKAQTNVITDIDQTKSILPTEIRLEQNYPNPFNPSTVISYSIPNIASDFSLSNVQLKVFDVLGRNVQTLVNKVQSAGNYKIAFDASTLPSGVYYYQLRIGDYSVAKKMLLLK